MDSASSSSFLRAQFVDIFAGHLPFQPGQRLVALVRAQPRHEVR
jgi:hypothetical protein